MEVKAVSIIIERDPMTKIPKVIPAWELEIYQAKYPGKIEVIGHSTLTVDELPDAESEAERMRELHGADSKSGVVFFDDVYGRGRAGNAEFEKAIHAARVRPGKPAKPAKVTETDSAGAGASTEVGGKDSGAEGSGELPDPLDDPA